MLNRREFLAAAASVLPLQAQAPKPPNLLFIVVDQLSGLALPGLDPNARMPNSAKLAQQGVTFTHAYTAGMTCAPSRASLDTGLHTQTHGIGGGAREIPPALESLSRSLAAHGYTSSHPNGYSLESERAEHEKWLGDLGYQQPLSSLNGVESMARFVDLPLKWKCGRVGLAPEHAFESYCANRAIRFLETNRGRPFACFLQLRGPHDPYMAPRPWDTLIDPAKLALPPFQEGELLNKPIRQRNSFETQGASKMTDAQIRLALSLYYGMAAYSDHCIGQVLARLTEFGLDDNTVVILTADHGDTMGRHRFMGKDFAFYEPAVRIPMILRAKGHAAGVRNADPVSGIDVFPTIAELLGLPKPTAAAGQSLVPRWDDKQRDPNRAIFAAQGVPGVNRAAMLRTPHFKYTRFDDGGTELYDLDRDPNELTNLADSPQYAAKLAELRGQLAEHERRYPITRK